MNTSSSANQTVGPGPIAWMAENHVAANLLMLTLLVGGLYTILSIKKEVFPDFELDLVSITVPYPGASPEEVERGIIRAIEENIRGLEGIKEIYATAAESRAQIRVELLEGEDSQRIYQDIQQEVARITTFPDDSERPIVRLLTRRREVLDLALYGDVSERTLRDQAELVRDRLLMNPNITQVDLSGVRDPQITVSISRDTLRKYGLTLRDISRKLESLAVELPGGGIKTRGGEILLRMKERRDHGDEFATLPIIAGPDGTMVKLGDIATVTDDFDEDMEQYASWNGMPAVMINVFRVGDQTPVSVSEAARGVLDQINEELPPHMGIVVRRDMSDIYLQRLELLSKNGLIGLVLVLAMLTMFLDAGLAFWVAMGIPISFLGGMILLPHFGVSINMISMFAFIVALGIVVDDAIVVGENIYEHRLRGDRFLYSAVAGTREVAMPVCFSIATNLVAFSPLMFLPGFIGKIWLSIPIVVMTVFVISLLECLFILPAHLSAAPRKRSGGLANRFRSWQQSFERAFMRSVNRIYGPILRFVLRNRYVVVAIGLSAVVITMGYVDSRRIGVVPMMRIESDYATVNAALPYGSPVERTRLVQDRLIATAQRVAAANGGDQLMRGIFAEIGEEFRSQTGGHVVEVRVYLTDPKQRPIPTSVFTDLWRKETGVIPGVEAILFESDGGGPGSGASLSIQLLHSDNEVLDQASAELAERLAEFPIVSDIDDGYSPGKPQLDFTMLPEGLALGLTSADVARQVRDAFYGAEALRQQRGRDEIKVKVKLPPGERLSEHDLDEMLIRTPTGADVPLLDVAKVKRGRAYTSINRKDGRRAVDVTANVIPRDQSENVLEDVMTLAIPELKVKYPGLSQGFSGRQEDLREGMNSLKSGFLVAMLCIYVILAIPFRSYLQPLIVMICIPFGLVGAVIAHIFMGYPLSLMSMMGMVALSGVVVNDSLLLIHYANEQRRNGSTSLEAILLAGIRRFRPIMLTTMTTFFGLAPIIFETSRQARFMIPMAISLGFGILFATLVTLILVPSLYLVTEDTVTLARAVFGLHKPKGE